MDPEVVDLEAGVVFDCEVLRHCGHSDKVAALCVHMMAGKALPLLAQNNPRAAYALCTVSLDAVARCAVVHMKCVPDKTYPQHRVVTFLPTLF